MVCWGFGFVGVVGMVGELFLLRGWGLEACGVWCFMSNSSPGPQIVFCFKMRCMVPLKWRFGEFPSAAAAFLCVALGRLGTWSLLKSGINSES